MTAKRRPADTRIPRWTRLLDLLDFEIVTPLPIDTAADRLYKAFDGGRQHKPTIVTFREIQHEVIDIDTLRVHMAVQGEGAKMSCVGLLRNGPNHTTFTGTVFQGVGIVFSTSLVMIPVIAATVFIVLGLFAVLTGQAEGSPFGLFLATGFLLWMFWSLRTPWRRHRRLRLEFVETLKYILTDERKGKAAP